MNKPEPEPEPEPELPPLTITHATVRSVDSNTIFHSA